MNRLQQIGCVVAMVLMPLMARAQDSSPVKVDFESKVIYADSLALPQNLNVGALIRLLPELLQRPGDRTLSNYEVQVDGVGVGGSADAILSVMQLADIEKLEVKNSPTSTDLNGGMSGSINLVLKPMGSKRKGTSGKVALGVSTESSLMTDVLMDYHGKKLTVRGMLFGEAYSAQKSTEVLQYGVPDTKATNNFWNQMARAMITYTPNERNKLDLTLTEGMNLDKHKIDDLTSMDENIQDVKTYSFINFERKSMLNARLNYNYQISRAQKLKLSAQYSHTPIHNWTDNEQGVTEYEYKSYENVAETSAELSGQWKIGEKGLWSYKVGTKGMLAKSNKQLMPLAELTLLYGPLRIKAGYEYQWNKEGRSDWTGRMVIGYQLSPGNRVRVLMNRQLNRSRMTSQEIGAEYITHHVWGKHQLTANVGVNSCKSLVIDDNDSNYKSANLMAVYQYDIFFLSLTANIFSHGQDAYEENANAKGKDYTYFNFSVMPSLNLKNGWRTALNLRYYSKVKTNVDEQGNCVSLQMNVGKSWGPWMVYAYGRLSLTGRVTYYNNIVDVTTLTPLVPTSAGCGASWSF